MNDLLDPLPRSAGSRPRPSRFRWAWWLLAYVSLGTGIVGIFVPGLPTTVFVLVAAYAAARGSDRLHGYLLQHPRFGPMIRDWQAHGAVSRRAKIAATLTMLVCAVILLLLMLSVASHRGWMAALPIACMTVVALWLWRRPEPPR
ncbi:MAG TPA: YbaN family protein [Pseudoxanthomonas sp.]